jgi:hypothetical protein
MTDASSSDDVIVPKGDFMLNLPHTPSMLEKG